MDPFAWLRCSPELRHGFACDQKSSSLTQKGPDESGPFESPWGEDSLAVTRLYGGNAQRVKQVVEGALQVNPLVRGATFGGVEEASSLCRGEGEMVRTSGWLHRKGTSCVFGRMHASTSSPVHLYHAHYSRCSRNALSPLSLVFAIRKDLESLTLKRGMYKIAGKNGCIRNYLPFNREKYTVYRVRLVMKR